MRTRERKTTPRHRYPDTVPGSGNGGSDPANEQPPDYTPSLLVFSPGVLEPKSKPRLHLCILLFCAARSAPISDGSGARCTENPPKEK